MKRPRRRVRRTPTREATPHGALGITGTPGVGKKSVSRPLAAILDAPLLEISGLAREHSTPDEHGELLVDVREVRSALSRRNLSGTIVTGHLLADVLGRSKAGFVAVLRCKPEVLKRRLASRGYPAEKVIENVEAELIGVVLDETVRRFGSGKVHEYDSTRASPASLARRIARDYLEGSAQSAPWIDWTLDYDSSTRLTSLLSKPRTGPAST